MQGLYKQMVDIFRSFGVEAVPGQGSIFDPNLHEAIMREPDNSLPEGTIIQEFRKGFKIGDKLIRAAMVKVFSLAAPECDVERDIEFDTNVMLNAMLTVI